MTQTYTAFFRTADSWATLEIEADSPRHALREARALFEKDANALDWFTYDPSDVALEEIEIQSPSGRVSGMWQSEELSLRLAAPGLLDALEDQTAAAEAVIDAWEQGDLAMAVRALGASMVDARAAIAKARLCKQCTLNS